MKIKRLFAAALTSCIAFSTAAFADEAQTLSPFKDVDATTAQGEAIVKMYEKGYLKGYEDGSFRPENSITRAELTRVFNQVFGYGLNEEAAENMQNFTDNFDKTAWYYNDVRIAQSNGYIKGFEDGSFRPKENFTREQTCTVIYTAAKLEGKEIAVEIADPVSEWAREYVNANIVNDVFTLEANSTFRAKENITRAEVCEALVKFVKDTPAAEVTSTNTETTDATTEATTTDATETTTKSSTSTGGGGGGGGGGGSSSGGSSSTVEPTTETTTISPADIEMNQTQLDAFARIIKVTKNEFIPVCYKADQKAIANKILATLEAYYADSTYDFTSDIQEVKDMYHQLSKEDQDEFMNKALSIYSVDDYGPLMPLFEAFL